MPTSRLDDAIEQLSAIVNALIQSISNNPSALASVREALQKEEARTQAIASMITGLDAVINQPPAQ